MVAIARQDYSKMGVSDVKYPVFFATAYSPEIQSARPQLFRFYEELAKSVERLKCHVFLPHRDIPRDITRVEIEKRVNENIHRSELVIADIGTPSTDVREMVFRGLSYGIRFIPFYRRTDSVMIDVNDALRHSERIQIEDDLEGARQIIERLKEYIG